MGNRYISTVILSTGEGDFVYSKIYSEVILVMVKRVGVGDS